MTPGVRARRRLLAGALLCGVLAPALLTGCAESVDPIERLGRKAAQKVPRKQGVPGGRGAQQVSRCGQAFRAADGVGAASGAGRGETRPPSLVERELQPRPARCPEGGGTPPTPAPGPPLR